MQSGARAKVQDWHMHTSQVSYIWNGSAAIFPYKKNPNEGWPNEKRGVPDQWVEIGEDQGERWPLRCCCWQGGSAGCSDSGGRRKAVWRPGWPPPNAWIRTSTVQLWGAKMSNNCSQLPWRQERWWWWWWLWCIRGTAIQEPRSNKSIQQAARWTAPLGASSVAEQKPADVDRTKRKQGKKKKQDKSNTSGIPPYRQAAAAVVDKPMILTLFKSWCRKDIRVKIEKTMERRQVASTQIGWENRHGPLMALTTLPPSSSVPQPPSPSQISSSSIWTGGALSAIPLGTCAHRAINDYIRWISSVNPLRRRHKLSSGSAHTLHPPEACNLSSPAPYTHINIILCFILFYFLYVAPRVRGGPSRKKLRTEA